MSEPTPYDRLPEGIERRANEFTKSLREDGRVNDAILVENLIKVARDVSTRLYRERRHSGQLMVEKDRIQQDAYGKLAAAEDLVRSSGYSMDDVVARQAEIDRGVWLISEGKSRLDQFRSAVLSLFSPARGIPEGTTLDAGHVERLRQAIFRANENAIRSPGEANPSRQTAKGSVRTVELPAPGSERDGVLFDLPPASSQVEKKEGETDGR